MDESDTRGAAEIAEHLTHELVQLIHVNVRHDRLHIHCDCRLLEYRALLLDEIRI